MRSKKKMDDEIAAHKIWNDRDLHLNALTKHRNEQKWKLSSVFNFNFNYIWFNKIIDSIHIFIIAQWFEIKTAIYYALLAFVWIKSKSIFRIFFTKIRVWSVCPIWICYLHRHTKYTSMKQFHSWCLIGFVRMNCKIKTNQINKNTQLKLKKKGKKIQKKLKKGE